MNESIGIVEPKKIILQGRLDLECGQSLTDIEIVYETYGNLNQDSSNAILICHALSAVSYTHLTLPTTLSV